jgi:hypothetical protein
MFKFFNQQKNTNTSSKSQHSELVDLIQQLRLDLSQGINQIQAEINDIKTSLEILEKRFNFKELKDKQQWGHLQYKLQEVPKKSEADMLAVKLNSNKKIS